MGARPWDLRLLRSTNRWQTASDGPRPLGWGPWELSGERGSNKQVKRKAPSEFEMRRAGANVDVEVSQVESENGTGRAQAPKWDWEGEGATLESCSQSPNSYPSVPAGPRHA